MEVWMHAHSDMINSRRLQPRGSELVSKEDNSTYNIEKLQTQHNESQRQIKNLETRLEEMQDQILSKLKVVDAMQEKNASLQKEIASLKNTLGCAKGTEMFNEMPSTPLQQISESKSIVTAKPSEKVVFSQFADSTSTVTALRGKSSSRIVRFPVSSLVTVDKSTVPSTINVMLQQQYFPCCDTIENEELGKGQDYVRSLFAGKKNISEEQMEKIGWPQIPLDYYNTSSSSTVGNLKIIEVHPDGQYVKIINSSDKEESIGDHILQQNHNGHPIASIKFPSNIRMKPNSSITVWAMSSGMPHKPPTDYLWKELDRFKASPEWTTILCNPAGQAIAWYTPINWMRNPNESEADMNVRSQQLISERGGHQQQNQWEAKMYEPWQGIPSQCHMEENGSDFIIREKKMPPVLYLVQNPWCQSPDSPTHPHFSTGRYLPSGRKEMHMLSQTRLQLVKPSPAPDTPSSGKSYNRQPGTGGNNRKSQIRPPRSAGARPRALRLSVTGTFLPLRDQHILGLQILQSAQNLSFYPPTPRPPPFAAW